MSVQAVLRWVERLQATSPPACALSERGAEVAVAAALNKLRLEDLEPAAALPGRSPRTACFIAARTVLTAPLEWCAVLLARGVSVTIKPAREASSWALWMAEAANQEGLPLRVVESPDYFADLVIVMGSDTTISTVQKKVSPNTQFLGFGHRFAVAWSEACRDADLAGIAADLALHDSRGCMSPVALFTPRDPREVLPRLAHHLETAERRWPRGECGPSELALIRARTSMSVLTDKPVETGHKWAIHGTSARCFDPGSLPRAIQVIHADLPQMRRILAPWKSWIGTVGTSDTTQAWTNARVCRLGEMQRPSIHRLHDGVDWLRETLMRT
jgi:hypothetical protein